MGQKRLKNETRKGKYVKAKKQRDKGRAKRQAEKLKDDKKATMTEGINLVVLVSFSLCFLKKRFNRHESGSQNDITKALKPKLT